MAAVGRAHPGATLHEAGAGTLDKAFDEMVAKDLRQAEMISLPITLVILVAFGAVVAAAVPLLIGLTSVVAAMGALGVISQIAPDGGTAGALVTVIGLAVGIDYSLFYIRREREERRAGKDAHAALDAAAATIGRAIVVSGLTVVVALAGLLFTGLTVFTSMALATMRRRRHRGPRLGDRAAGDAGAARRPRRQGPRAVRRPSPARAPAQGVGPAPRPSRSGRSWRSSRRSACSARSRSRRSACTGDDRHPLVPAGRAGDGRLQRDPEGVPRRPERRGARRHRRPAGRTAARSSSGSASGRPR